MKKQILFLISGLIITSASHSMEKKADPFSSEITLVLAPKAGEISLATPATEVKNEEPVVARNHAIVFAQGTLESCAKDTKIIQQYMDNCLQQVYKNTGSFTSSHATLEQLANAFYLNHFILDKTAKICANSPTCNTMAAKAKRILERLETMDKQCSDRNALSDTLSGLLQTLKDAKENANKN